MFWEMMRIRGMKHNVLTSSYISLHDKLYRVALRYLNSEEDAKDALQDVWLRLSKAGEIESEPEARNKLVAVLRNLCIDRLRRLRSVPMETIDNLTVVPVAVMPTEDVARLERILKSGLSS